MHTHVNTYTHNKETSNQTYSCSKNMLEVYWNAKKQKGRYTHIHTHTHTHTHTFFKGYINYNNV